MTRTGADWSTARPTGAQVKAAGVWGVMRYLADSGDGREIEKAEFTDLTANGIQVGFVREGYSTGILGGYSKGVSDAQVAVANLSRLGLSNQVVYAAADFDIGFGEVNGLNGSQQIAAADDYMRGFASVLTLDRTGIYGGMYYLNHCRSSLAKWFWKSAASSWDHGQTGAVHLEQTTNTPPLPDSDHNYIYNDNYGQAAAASPVQGRKIDMPLVVTHSGTGGGVFVFDQDYVRHVKTSAQVTALTKAFGPAVTFNDADFTTIMAYYGLQSYSLNQVIGLAKAPAGPGGILRAPETSNAGIKFPGAPPVTLTDDQVKQLADQISAQIDAGATPDQVTQIVTTALSTLKLGAIQ